MGESTGGALAGACALLTFVCGIRLPAPRASISALASARGPACWDGRAARRCATSGHKRALATALDDPLVAEIVKSRSSDQAVAVELHDDNALVIYTDGSCLQKPRRGGYAYRLVTVDSAGDEVTVDYGGPGFAGATNNEMELWACVEALKHLAGRRPPVPREAHEKVVVYTDSMYVYEGVPRAASVWPRSG